jgi:predicted ester cyclase
MPPILATLSLRRGDTDIGALQGFPDGTITVVDQVAEGELVATRWTARGTNAGQLMGMPPTGKQVTVNGVTYARIADGRAREAWLSWDTLSMMQ